VEAMLAILGGLGAALAWTATTLAASRASRLIDVWSLLATVMTVGLLVSAPVAAIAGVPSGLNRDTFGWLVVSGTANVAGLLLTYAALSVGKVGVVAPVTSTEGAVAAVIAVMAGEQLSGGTAATLVAIAAGVALAAHTPAVDGRVPRSEVRAVVLAAGAALSFGLGLYSTGHVGQTLGVAWAALPPRVVGVLVIALPLLLARRWRMTRAALPYAVAGGLCEVLGFVSYAFGARHGLAVAAVLASQFAGIAAVASYFFFRERLTRVQVVGVVGIVCGVSVLSALHG
jgi:drug/metabolite transporter (DMT)-like permease